MNRPTHNRLMTLAAASGVLAVALGAFGAHALDQKVSVARMATWETAVLYHFVHVFALVIAALLLRLDGLPVYRSAGLCHAAGTLLFSGSLYLLVAFDMPVLGMVTPVGGVFFMAGWALLALGQWQGRRADGE